MTERLIERGFPIVQLNALSLKERNAFKPIYKMHKWFARRSSSIFRAILLGAALPSSQGDDWMKEFYAGHKTDNRLKRPDGTPLRVLDPFMGGGTTVVEALRLGLDVTGNDYNPIAWFIVKAETSNIDPARFENACARLAAKVRDDLLGLYKTECPATGAPADIIFGFWVKQGICIDPKCRHHTDLFKSYVIGRIQGDLGVYYLPDVTCPECKAVFDWEIERCTITAGGPQVSGSAAAGIDRPRDRAFAFAPIDKAVKCPNCSRQVAYTQLAAPPKKAKKKVLVQVLVDPSNGDFFEVRGEVPDEVRAPASGFVFAPEGGPADDGKFSCARCGRQQEIVASARANGAPLPFRYYGKYAFTSASSKSPTVIDSGLPTNNNKWFSRATEDDLRLIAEATHRLKAEEHSLPLPQQQIYDGYNTNRLVIHQYKRWCDLYGPRQLLALGLLGRAIAEEPDYDLRDALLGAFQSHLDNASNLCSYNPARNMIRNVGAAHDYRNPTTAAENNTWGVEGMGQGPFVNCLEKVREGLLFARCPTLSDVKSTNIRVDDVDVTAWRPRLLCSSATDLGMLGDRSFDLIITDPPYAGSVQYAEMSDWSYVWLHQLLKRSYEESFGAETVLKAEEIIENGSDKDSAFFFERLAAAWRECFRLLVDDGLLVFTFHHKEGDRWTGLLKSLFEAGFYLVAAYPTHSEALNSIVIQATKGITYDIVHVCRKRVGDPEPIAWSRLRRDVTRAAREQLREIEQGKDVLPSPDVQMILLGKALMLFSKHYGKVLDADGERMDLDEAMERILVLVREVRGEELPLPGALQDLDSLTHIALLHVVGKGPWARDDLHKELRGYTHGPAALLEAGLIREVKGQRARLEAVSALDRGAKVNATRREAPMIDKLHALLATVNEGRSIEKLMKEWRGKWDLIVEALTWLAKVDASVKELANLTIRQIGTLGPDKGPPAIAEQLDMFAAK